MENNKAVVVFWAHYKSNNTEHHNMERFYEEKCADDFYEWAVKTQESIEKNIGKYCTMTNCGIIR